MKKLPRVLNIFVSKVYQFPLKLEMITDIEIKHEGKLSGLHHPFPEIKERLALLLPEYIDSEHLERLNNKEKVTNSELLKSELENLISETLCHQVSLSSVDKHFLPMIEILIDYFPILNLQYRENQLDNEELYSTLISNFTFIASCGNDFSEKIVTKAAYRCAKNYDHRYDYLPKELALILIRNYASTKAREFEKRQIK